MRPKAPLLSMESIEHRIFLIRGQKVMLDRDLAELYGVGTRDLNKAVTRNPERFPSDFMFSLTRQEVRDLMFHFGTSSWGGIRKPPRAFTEHGVLMLSSVLRSKRAIQVNITIMRTFLRLRQVLAAHKELAQKLVELERQVEGQSHQIHSIFDAIRQLMAPTGPSRRRIGFHSR